MYRGAAVELLSALDDYRSAGLGVIAGFGFDVGSGATGPGQAIAPEALDGWLQALGHSGCFVWVHLNCRNDHGRTWLTACPHIPEAAREFLTDAHALPGRSEAIPTGVLGCLSDLAYDFNGDPGEIRSFRFYVSRSILLTVREDPISATNGLRLAIRDGRPFVGTLALLNALLDYQGEALRKIADDAEDRLERIEDRVFGGAQEVEEGAISRIRWLCGRLQRRFAPEQKILGLLRRSVAAIGGGDDQEHLAERIQQFDETLATLGDIQSRARLLQEEIDSRQASATSRNLYFLSIFTAIMLPVTLVTGVFGMNVAGLPGTKSEDAFLWVIGGMALLAVFTLLAMRLKRLI